MISRFIAAALAVFLGFAPPSAATASSAHDFTFEAIEGGAHTLADYAGRPVLVVNTASRCGFTHQYDGLQSLWERYRDRGLIVLGVPSNDFRQELANDAAVKRFCEVNFSIDFPMTSITSVVGPTAHPFFAWAAEEKGAPRWNFTKYLLGPDGRLIGRWGTGTRPSDPAIIDAIEAALPQG